MSLGQADPNVSPVARTPSALKGWLRALEMTAPLSADVDRLLPAVIENLADQRADAPALLSDRERFTYRMLSGRANQYARWALAQGVRKGDTVCLFMRNQPEYFAIWLGIVKVGGIVSLLNTNLVGPSLAHCINIVTPKHIIVDGELGAAFSTIQAHLVVEPEIWFHGGRHEGNARIDTAARLYSPDPLTELERRPLATTDPALIMYTSGTTGLPKAAKISHYRVTHWSHWFAGMMDVGATDRMYDCLPMYHSVGGVVAIGAPLVMGGSVVIKERFSATEFWPDIRRWDCTLFQYIGELCRYLLHAEPHPEERKHRIRLCCGNGLRPDVWEKFQDRFGIPQIFEFYASTEGNVSLFNVEGKPGAIGRHPPFLAHRLPTRLVRFDVEAGAPARNESGFCIACGPDEVGEAIGQISDAAANISGRFEGYTSAEDTEKKILRNVFVPGDAWFRTGDLMRKDSKGYFYFIDRVGDTFRWKGENVSTLEVSEAIATFPGIKEANVYGVEVQGRDGRAGMAALVLDENFNLSAFRKHLAERLPDYAQPLLLRIRDAVEVTATFKHVKTELARQGFDPARTPDVIYFNDREKGEFVRLDKPLYDRIQTGGEWL